MDIYFSKFKVNSQVFFKSKHTYALVNLKPIVPGHVLVVPLRVNTPRLADLSHEESMDYMQTIQLVHRFIKYIYKADSLNLSIQDGPESGQSIPHLHTHIIPRYKQDGFGDEIYAKIEDNDLGKFYVEFELRKKAFQMGKSFKETMVNDEDRHARSEEEMEKESTWLKKELDKYIEQNMHI